MQASSGLTHQTYADLAHENYMLLTALWRHVWQRWPHYVRCLECDTAGAIPAAVKHAPGCALFGVDRTILAQLDAFDAMPEPV